MQQELRFATFNVCNLALPGQKYYDDQPPYTAVEYEAKTSWIAQKLDELDADVIGFQEIFSQAALKDVLAKSRKYQQAHHIGLDPPSLGRLSPSVALVSRLPALAGPNGVTLHSAFPHDLRFALPGVDEALASFTRPVLHAQLMMSPDTSIHVFVCHLKSKRPDYRNGNAIDPDETGIAILRSLLRRSADAMGLRMLLTDCMTDGHGPLLAMGDFNDVAGAVSTQLVMGAGNCPRNGSDDQMFDSFRIQTSRYMRNVGYTHVHDGNYETVDHVLVSREFNPASRFAIGEVIEVLYLNDHIALKPPEASDHGLVLVRIGMHDSWTTANAPGVQLSATTYFASGSPAGGAVSSESGTSPSAAT